MAPESLIAFLLVVCVLGLAGLSVVFYLFRKKTMSRLDTFVHTIDSLDERFIHELKTHEKKIEELHAKVIEIVTALKGELEETLGKESNDRAESIDRLRESLENLASEQGNFQEKIQGEIEDDLRKSLSQVSEKAESNRERFEGFRDHVDRVRLRNDLQLSHSLFAAGEFGQAGEILESLLAEEPENKEAALLASKAFLSARDREKASSVLRSALENFPGDPDLLAELARIAGLEGDRAEQARIIAEGLVRSPNHPRLHFERALLHIESENHDVARHDLEQVLAGGLETAEIRYNLGMVYISLGDIPAGMRELRRSIGLDPLSAEGNHALGLALTHVERYREAVDFLERARELKPDDVTIRLDLAAALRLSESPSAALDEASVAAELDSSLPRVSLERALAHHDLAEFAQALTCLDTVLGDRPDFRRARELRAEIFGELERHKEAVDEWTILTQQLPEDAALKARLAAAYKAAGDPGRTLGYLQMASRMAPQSGEIQLQFARESLAQEKLPLVQEALEMGYPSLTTPQLRLQFIEGRLLLLVKLGRFGLLDPLLRDLKAVLEKNPESIPLDRGFGIEEKDLLSLNLSREGARLHNGLLELYAGNSDFDDFDDLITRVMRSLLPPPTPPAPAPEPETPAVVAVEASDNGRDQPVEPSATEAQHQQPTPEPLTVVVGKGPTEETAEAQNEEAVSPPQETTATLFEGEREEAPSTETVEEAPPIGPKEEVETPEPVAPRERAAATEKSKPAPKKKTDRKKSSRRKRRKKSAPATSKD